MRCLNQDFAFNASTSFRHKHLMNSISEKIILYPASAVFKARM